MTNSKHTKRALIASAMSIIVCVAMLIGTTFAWFTDTASTAVNKIVSGKLDVELEMQKTDGSWTTAEGQILNFKTADNRTTNILWEPGCTYELPKLRIKNNGNLALKYKVTITGIKGDAKLNEVIDWTIGDVALGTEQHLLPGADNEFTIKGHMLESAGNDYMNIEIKDIAITVVATQDTVENDSIDNTYDENATYPVTNAAQLQSALAKDGIFNLTNDVDPTDTLIASAKTTFDASGKTVSNSNDVWETTPISWSLVSARGTDAELTISGNGNFKAKDNDCYAVDVQDGAKVIIKNGTFIGNIHAVYVLEGEAVIEGGFFSVVQKYPDASKADEFVLNCYDANRENGTAKITVTGGTFVNFNPADCYAEGAHTNFVADGYKVVSEAHGTDTWYTVVAE